jgi:hypothetical protein
MSKTYTVNLNGRPVKSFKDQAEAKQYMVHLVSENQSIHKKIAEVDAAVLLSDLKEANEVIKHIRSL